MLRLRKRGIPFIFTPRGKLSPGALAQSYWSKRLWWSLVGHRAVTAASRIVISADTETVPRALLGLPEDVDVVPNGYEPIDTTVLQSQFRQIISKPTVLFLSSLDPRKRPDLLIDAFAASETSHTHDLWFVGPDTFNERGKLEKLVQQKGCGDKIRFYGPAYGIEKQLILMQATCFCMPSTGEGFPMALCEAMGAGLPLIVSQNSNFGVAARAGAAIELEAFTVNEWASAIDAVCLHPSRQKQMHAAALALAPRFTWDATIDQWVEIYRKILGDRRTRTEE